MRVKTGLRLVIAAVAIAISVSAATAGQIGTAHTSNPGSMNYYPNPWLSRSPDFGYAFDACQQAHRHYGEVIVVRGMKYTCP
jgi:hypothetical protein